MNPLLATCNIGPANPMSQVLTKVSTIPLYCLRCPHLDSLLKEFNDQYLMLLKTKINMNLEHQKAVEACAKEYTRLNDDNLKLAQEWVQISKQKEQILVTNKDLVDEIARLKRLKSKRLPSLQTIEDGGKVFVCGTPTTPLNEKVSILTKQVEDLQKEKKDLEDEVASLNVKVAELEEAKRVLEEKDGQHHADAFILAVEKSDLEDEVSILKKQMEEKVSNLEKELNSKLSATVLVSVDRLAKIKALEEKLKQSESRVDSLLVEDAYNYRDDVSEIEPEEEKKKKPIRKRKVRLTKKQKQMIEDAENEEITTKRWDPHCPVCHEMRLEESNPDNPNMAVNCVNDHVWYYKDPYTKIITKGSKDDEPLSS